MEVFYAVDTLPDADRVPNSIFLAGPTPRSDEVPSWRPEALTILKHLGFDGIVYVPEAEGGGWHGDYEEQVLWEWRALGQAACTHFWIPRELPSMPGFTTNVEFGFLMALRANRVVLSAPHNAPKLRYLKTLAEKQSDFWAAFGHWERGVGSYVHQAQTLERGLQLAQLVASQDIFNG